MGVPRRITRQTGRHALVDGIPFHLPIASHRSPVLMAAFSIDAGQAGQLLPGNEVHPFRLWNQGVLLVTVVDYRDTVIGKYIEFSVGIACTHGRKPAPRLLPGLLLSRFGTGQYVFDLPVSTEISVKGGKGIWGMPKHQANLDFVIGDRTVSSQYDKDGRLALRIEIDRPPRARIPVRAGAVNYCQFRGMLMKSYVYFRGKAGVILRKKGSARLTIGSHPRVQPLKQLAISEHPILVAFFPETEGILNDYFESWFLSADAPPGAPPEGLESVVDLGLGQSWLEPPSARE